MYHFTKFSGSLLLSSLLLTACSSDNSDQQEVYQPADTAVINKSVVNTKRNLQRELVVLENGSSEGSASLGAVIATFINDDLSDNTGEHFSVEAARTFFEDAGLDVSDLDDDTVNELMVYAYFNAVSESFGVEEDDFSAAVSSNGPRRIFGIGTRFKELIKDAGDKIKDGIVDVVDNVGIVSNISNEVFKIMLQSGTMTKEMLRLAIKSRTITDIMIEVMDDHWGLAEQMQPLLENDVDFGHLFMDLALAHDYVMAEFLFSRIDGPMYLSLTKAMTLSREDVGNGSAGKTTRVLSELMAMPRMAKFFNVPSTLEYTDAQDVEAFSKLLFSNGTAERGDGNEMANERFFYEIFATAASTANFVSAMNNIDEDIRLALMDQIFLGESDFSQESDAQQGYYNIYAIAGGMAYGLGVGAANYAQYEDSLYAFAELVPVSRYYSYGLAFSTAGYTYYSSDNQAYISNFRGLIYGTAFDSESDLYDYTTWIDFDEEGLRDETIVNRFYQFVLNRLPDPEGEAALLQALQTTDHTLIAESFVTAAADEIGVTTDEAFVSGLYVYGLKRAPDEAGLNHWLTQLQNGMSRGEVLLAFVNSEEAGGDSWIDELSNAYENFDYTTWLDFDSDGLEDETVVERFYQFVLGREADEVGESAYLAALQREDVQSVAASFVENANAETGVLTDREFVTALYTNGLEREPDASGLEYWVNELQSGVLTRGNVLVAFIYSEEAGGDSWWDDLNNFVGSSYEEASLAFDDAFNALQTNVLALFNDMSFDQVFEDDTTKIEYFVSNSSSVAAASVTYSDTSYTDVNLYASEAKWAYLPGSITTKDWIVATTESLDMNFSFSSGHVTAYIVSTLSEEEVAEVLPTMIFTPVDLDGNEPLSTIDEAVYNVYETEILSGTNIHLNFDALGSTVSAIFFDADSAIADPNLLP